MRQTAHLFTAGILILTLTRLGYATDAAELRLVPFPKDVQLQDGTFDLRQNLILETRIMIPTRPSDDRVEPTEIVLFVSE